MESSKLLHFSQVPASTVRSWALVDSPVIALALPVTANGFLTALYFINGLLGHPPASPPAFEPIQMFFVNLSGVMVALWVAVRLWKPTGEMAFADATGRTVVGLLIIWYLLARDAPQVLWLFVLSEWLGAAMQFRSCYSARSSV